MKRSSEDPMKGCVFVDSQNVYYTLKKWINKALPEKYVDWDYFFEDIFQNISNLQEAAVVYQNSYWFRPTKFIDFYPDKRMMKHHLSIHFDESIANDFINNPHLMSNPNEKRLLDILFQYEREKDKQHAVESKNKYGEISKKYGDFCAKHEKMHFIETGFIKYDFIKKERTEKAVDVSLASHLLFCAMASDEHLRITNGEHIKIPPADVVVLLSNDDDYVETVRLLEAIDFPVYVVCFRTGKNQKTDLMDKTKGNRFIFEEKDLSRYLFKKKKLEA